MHVASESQYVSFLCFFSQYTYMSVLRSTNDPNRHRIEIPSSSDVLRLLRRRGQNVFHRLIMPPPLLNLFRYCKKKIRILQIFIYRVKKCHTANYKKNNIILIVL